MINADVLTKAGIDYNAGLERFMNDPELYEKVLAAFTRANITQRARAAYDANDRETLLKVAHEAKGSSGNAGLSNLYTKANELVQLLRSGNVTDDELTESYLRFERLCVSTQTAIKTSLES